MYTPKLFFNPLKYLTLKIGCGFCKTSQNLLSQISIEDLDPGVEPYFETPAFFHFFISVGVWKFCMADVLTKNPMVWWVNLVLTPWVIQACFNHFQRDKHTMFEWWVMFSISWEGVWVQAGPRPHIPCTASKLASDSGILGDLRWQFWGSSTPKYWSEGSIRSKIGLVGSLGFQFPWMRHPS